MGCIGNLAGVICTSFFENSRVHFGKWQAKAHACEYHPATGPCMYLNDSKVGTDERALLGHHILRSASFSDKVLVCLLPLTPPHPRPIVSILLHLWYFWWCWERGQSQGVDVPNTVPGCQHSLFYLDALEHLLFLAYKLRPPQTVKWPVGGFTETA